MKLTVRETLELGFVDAWKSLMDDPAMNPSQRWWLSRSLKVIKQEHKALDKRKKEYIEEHGVNEGDQLLKRWGKIKAQEFLDASTSEMRMAIESRISSLIAHGTEDSKFIPTEDPKAFSAWETAWGSWLDAEFEIPLAAQIDPSETKIGGTSMLLLDSILAMAK